MNVFDLYVDDEKSLQIHGALDGDFILDKIEEANQTYSNLFSSTGAYSIGWPYICFSGFNNRLVMSNLFEKKTFHRIQITKDDEDL